MRTGAVELPAVEGVLTGLAGSVGANETRRGAAGAGRGLGTTAQIVARGASDPDPVVGRDGPVAATGHEVSAVATSGPETAAVTGVATKVVAGRPGGGTARLASASHGHRGMTAGVALVAVRMVSGGNLGATVVRADRPQIGPGCRARIAAPGAPVTGHVGRTALARVAVDGLPIEPAGVPASTGTALMTGGVIDRAGRAGMIGPERGGSRSSARVRWIEPTRQVSRRPATIVLGSAGTTQVTLGGALVSPDRVGRTVVTIGPVGTAPVTIDPAGRAAMIAVARVISDRVGRTVLRIGRVGTAPVTIDPVGTAPVTTDPAGRAATIAVARVISDRVGRTVVTIGRVGTAPAATDPAGRAATIRAAQQPPIVASRSGAHVPMHDRIAGPNRPSRGTSVVLAADRGTSGRASRGGTIAPTDAVASRRRGPGDSSGPPRTIGYAGLGKLARTTTFRRPGWSARPTSRRPRT